MSEFASSAVSSAATPLAGTSQAYRLKIAFTGSGSEYFRIWIVNMLLMLLTIGIYYPWAKVRRLRYFYGNTVVEGEPLDFHGDPKKMLKGYFLVGLLFTLYSAAGQFSAAAGLVAFLIVAAIWPALLKSSMQFRMANTSWRGLRFRFNGSLGDAYRAVLPMFVPALVVVVAATQIADPQKPPGWYVAVMGFVGLAVLLALPRLMWNIKKYQHNHYGLASLQTTFRASAGSFYKLSLKAFGLLLLAVVLIAVLVGIVAGVTTGLRPAPGTRPMAVFFGLAMLGMVLYMLSLFVIAKPYFTTRLQNLVWTNTGNASLRFLSDLRFRKLLGLTLKNWLLIILTLGLYWPFAAVNTARMRLEAVRVKTRVNPETLISLMRPAEGDAVGEAGGDLFGFDIGL